MLYIHGSLEEGSGHQPLRPSGHLARKLNTIFVSIDYRLNAFGFLTLDLLANSNANSSHGNYGLWDVIEGIHWIKKNIAAFGGDSKKLTVFGPDGDLILSLISNYEYSSLIQNAWILESRFLNRKSFAQQSKISRKNFLSKTNCSTVDCLKNLSGNEVLDIFRLNQIRAENISFIVSDGMKIFKSIFITVSRF
jgi:carboxylesterase type B